MIGYYIIAGIMLLVGMYVSNQLKSKFAKYNQIGLRAGFTGKEIAEKMLHDNGIYDVKIQSVDGSLTDHYNPADKTVNLSSDVYNSRSIAAASVAAHECGHAVQHAQGYSMLKFRSAIVPLVNISSKLSQWIIIIGLGFIFGRSNPTILLIGILLFAITTLFTLITLPVEYDASNRALKWMESTHITTPEEHEWAVDALKWAARTYLVAAISSVATLLYYLFLFNSSRRRD